MGMCHGGVRLDRVDGIDWGGGGGGGGGGGRHWLDLGEGIDLLGCCAMGDARQWLGRGDWSMGVCQMTKSYISKTGRQSNYPNKLAPKRGSQRRFCFDPNLTWWAYQAISLLSRPGTLSAGGLISPLFSPAFDDTFDQLQLIRATLIFKMQKDW